MKEKFNVKGFMKRAMYGFMNYSTLAFSCMVDAFNIYATVYCLKNKEYRSSAKYFAYISAISTFQVVRNAWMTKKYLDVEICPYNWTIIVPDKENEKVEEI